MAHSELEIGKKCQYTLVLVLEKNSFNFENSTFSWFLELCEWWWCYCDENTVIKKRLRLVLPSVVLKFWWQLAKQYQFTKLGIFWFPTFLQNWGKYIYSWGHRGFSQHKTRWQDGIIIRIIWFDSILFFVNVPMCLVVPLLGYWELSQGRTTR